MPFLFEHTVQWSFVSKWGTWNIKDSLSSGLFYLDQTQCFSLHHSFAGSNYPSLLFFSFCASPWDVAAAGTVVHKSLVFLNWAFQHKNKISGTSVMVEIQFQESKCKELAFSVSH